MNNRQSRAVALLVLLCAAVPLSIAHDAGPRVLRQTGLIRDLRDTHDEPCIGNEGGGADFNHWHLDPDKTKIEIKLRKGTKRYVDVLWRWPHELQDANFHVANAASPPIPEDICESAWYELEDHLFLFSIHDLKDHHDRRKPKSPHALVYVPMHTIVGGYPALADQFYLFIFKIEKDDETCDAETGPAPQERCKALRRLYLKNAEYLSNSISEAVLIAAIKNEIEKVIPPVGAFQRSSTATSPITFAPHLHNGIIHGTLGGG